MNHSLTPADIITATGTALLSSEQAGKLLGYPTTNAFLEELRRGKLALPTIKRGHKHMFTATGIAELINRADNEFQERNDPPLPEDAKAAADTITPRPGTISATDDREWLRSIATRAKSSRASRPKTHANRDVAA